MARGLRVSSSAESQPPPGARETRPVHPEQSVGRYFGRRLAVAITLTVAYLGLPHLRIHGEPAFQIDLEARQLHLVGATFFATETLFLVVLGIGLVIFIALFTALFGRVWCGWACPQPIYLEFVFRPLESLLEGRAVRRRRARRQPWQASLLLRKLVKLGLYLLVASILAHTFVAYFVGTDALLEMIRRPPRESWGSFVAMAVVTGMILLDFAWARELTCVIACPYGRLQSLLIDARSWIVGYDATRGEPRRRLAARRDRSGGAGDCIDCESCRRTCPTGIDIRDGLQLECIGCTQCIDACDQIMDRIGRPRGLIRYTSLDRLRGVKTTFWRPRVFLYAAVVLAAAVALTLLIITRHSFESDLVRVTGAPFYVQSDGKICNRIRLRLTNRLPEAGRFEVTLVEPDPAELIVGQLPLELDPLQVHAVEGIVRVSPDAMSEGSRLARIRVEAADGSSRDHVFMLLGPQGGAP